MTSLMAAFASVGWLVAYSAWAQADSGDSGGDMLLVAMEENDAIGVDTNPRNRRVSWAARSSDSINLNEYSRGEELSRGLHPAPGELNLQPEAPLSSFSHALHLVRRVPDLAVSYRLPASGGRSVFGYVGIPGEPALGPPVSYMRRYAGFDSADPALASHWLDSTGSNPRVFTVGYAWRDLKLEGSAFSSLAQEDPKPPGNGWPRLDSRSARLSFNPSSNWAFQLSRGSLSGLDQLVPNEEVRRTTISATYNLLFTDGNWQTTLAWGRNARKYRETTMGYLLESTLRFSGSHAVFGRLEQVGSDGLIRENETAQRQMFKMNRVSLGYFHEVQSSGPLKFDVGVFMSRHLIPAAAAPSYGSDPTSYMFFLRLKLQ